MDSTVFVQHLRESSLEEGRAYIQEHCGELADLDATGDLLADEALKLLFNPFLSLKLAELLIFFGETMHHVYSHALGLKAKGDVLVQIGHHQAAIDCLDMAGEEFLSLGDDRNWARSRISWITASTMLTHVEEALEAAARARDVFLRAGELYWVCIMDHNTAVIHTQVGRFQDALKLYDRLLAIYPTLTDQSETFIKRAIAMAEVNQALVLIRLGKFEQAYGLLQQAQASFMAVHEVGQAVNAEIHLAQLDDLQGYYGSAVRRYYQARDILTQNNVDNPRLLAELKLQMAVSLVKLNRAHEACQLAQESVDEYRRASTSLQESNAILAYATALAAASRLKEAIAALDEALALFNQGGFDHHALATKLQRAEILLQLGQAAEAYEEARLAREYAEAQGLVARSVHAGLIMAHSLLELTRQAKGQREYMQEAMSLAKRIAWQAHRYHLQEEVYKSQYLLGQLFAEQGDSEKAARHYGAAIARIERILDNLAFDLSPFFLQRAWTVYEDMIALCLSQGEAERAFGYLERARSMALRQYRNRRPGEAASESTGTMLSGHAANMAQIERTKYELKTWQDRYRKYSSLASQVDASLSLEVDSSIIEAELKRCEAKVGELFEHLYLQQATTAIPRQHRRGRKSSATSIYPDAAQLRRRLAPGQLLLAYFLYYGRLVIFALTSESLVTHEIPDGMKQLQRLLAFLHAHLQPGGWPDPQQPPQQGVLQMLNKLYKLLIAPVEALLPPDSQSLTIVPYGPLHTLPFHALYDGTHFLIEKYQINYLPASTLLVQPDVPRAEPRISLTETKVALKPPLIFGYSGHRHIQRALEEAEALAALLDGRCYLEEEATISRLIEEAPGSPIIHLATHGHSRLDAPNFSSILLADGQFNAIDTFDLNLKGCQLVTLSGCETGLAVSGGGDEQLGLGRAFLAAGADTLVMSLWPVEDDATGELMQIFYRYLLDGESKVQALRTAQCSLIQRSASPYSHPYYWAAFRLVGETGPLKNRTAQHLSLTVETDPSKNGSSTSQGEEVKVMASTLSHQAAKEARRLQ